MAGRNDAPEEAPHPPSRWSLSLVIPAYNEAAGIHQAIAEADQVLSQLADDYEILVVDDGSTDATAAAVSAAAGERSKVRLLRHPANRGYGAALRTGFQAAQFDRVAFTDADCQFDLADLDRLVSLTATTPLAVGYRLARQDSWLRCFYSWGYNRLTRLLLGTGVRDCDCALKVFRRDALVQLLPETTGFFVNTEMLTRARQHRYAIAEAGVRHRPRLRGQSKVSLGDIPRTLATLLPFWWSRVLFPQSDTTRSPARGPMAPASGLLAAAIFLAAALLFFWHLDSPLQEPDEARYAEIPRQMLGEARWVVPVLHGQPYYDKPPLFYWAVMASYQTFGVHDWAARLAASGSAFLTVLVTYLWGRRVAGRRAALASVLILALSGRFVYLGRLLTPDSLLCLCVVAALAAAHRAVVGSRLQAWAWLASAVACGLGLLTKGPVALVLVGGPLLAFQLLDPRVARAGWRSWATYVGVALGVALPWYAAMALAEPEFITHFFWKHNVLRYIAPFDHAEPVWFYLPGVVLGMLPWTLLLPGLCRFLGRRRPARAARRPPALGFFLLTALWILAFYSCSGCKRAVYVLPALPPLALALGCYLDAILPRETLVRAGLALWQRGSVLAYRATLLVLGAGCAACLSATGAGLLRPLSGGLLAGATALSLAALWHTQRRQRPSVSWAACGAATFALLFVAIHQLQPGYASRFSLRGNVRPLAALAQKARTPVASYPRQWDSISFYLRRSDVHAYGEGQLHDLIVDLRAAPETLLFVKSGKDLERLRRDLPTALEFVEGGGPRGIVTAGWVRVRDQNDGGEGRWLARQ